jgi:hypothetical protein
MLKIFGINLEAYEVVKRRLAIFPWMGVPVMNTFCNQDEVQCI